MEVNPTWPYTSCLNSALWLLDSNTLSSISGRLLHNMLLFLLSLKVIYNLTSLFVVNNLVMILWHFKYVV